LQLILSLNNTFKNTDWWKSVLLWLAASHATGWLKSHVTKYQLSKFVYSFLLQDYAIT
jgi:hypothetical protein